MIYVFASLINILIGVLNLLPTQDITVDLSSLTEYMGIINYFIPIYLIYPILLAWSGFIALYMVSTATWGFFKRHI